jgi:hypothetical protein
MLTLLSLGAFLSMRNALLRCWQHALLEVIAPEHESQIV